MTTTLPTGSSKDKALPPSPEVVALSMMMRNRDRNTGRFLGRDVLALTRKPLSKNVRSRRARKILADRKVEIPGDLSGPHSQKIPLREPLIPLAKAKEFAPKTPTTDHKMGGLRLMAG